HDRRSQRQHHRAWKRNLSDAQLDGRRQLSARRIGSPPAKAPRFSPGKLVIQKRVCDYFAGALGAADWALASSLVCKPRVFRRIFWRALRRRCSRDLSPLRNDICSYLSAMLQHLSKVCCRSAAGRRQLAGMPSGPPSVPQFPPEQLLTFGKISFRPFAVFPPGPPKEKVVANCPCRPVNLG